MSSMRRGNKSHKVPNVKLRPAQQPTRSTRAAEPDACYDRSSDSEAPPNASMVDLCPRPFKNITLSATGTMDKPTLFKMAFELGATSTSDFTDRVTHLIANSHGGAKYACALERKIPIMRPEWIMEAHAVWLRGDDVDVEESVSKHRLPIFSGVVLCLSGIDDIARRTEINRLVTAHQGEYRKELERPVKVTHLLCSGDIETDKMKYAEKFNKRGEANIHLVWEEWFWDCLEFGGRFDERKYQVSRPRPERKSLLEIPLSSVPVQDSAPGSNRNSAIPVDRVQTPRRSKPPAPTGSFAIVNNLAADGDEEEVASVKKPVPAVTLQLWQTLLKPRGYELEGGKLVRSPSKSQTTQSPPSTPTRPRPKPTVVNRNGNDQGKEKEKESVISTFRRANSFAPVPVKENAVRQPFRRNTTVASFGHEEAEGSRQRGSPHQEESAISALFSGYTFRLLGEARCQNVRSAIENCGGIVTDDDAEVVSFIVVRLISGSKLYRDETDEFVRSKYRTECWLEHSVFHERICEPDENVSFTPLTIMTPVPDAEKITISFSGLDQSELCWIRRLVRALAITLAPTFSRKSTHLLCPSGTGAKYDKALEWRIPVISIFWLEAMARSGSIPPVNDYLVGESCIDTPVLTDEAFGFGPAQGLESAPALRIDKGKGKAKEVDFQMTDVTNVLDTSEQPMFIKNPGLLDDTALGEPAYDAPDRRVPQPLPPDMDVDRGPPRSGDGGMFGKPRFLSHESDPPDDNQINDGMPSSPPAPPPQSSSPPLGVDELPMVEPEPEPMPPKRAVEPPRATPIRRAATLMNIFPQQTHVVGESDSRARVASSNSPSPMKLLPSSSLPDAFDNSSPVRPNQNPHPPDTEAVAKALHETLTTLLGKRQISNEESELGAGRKGKRVRPVARSNAQSRQTSRENVLSPDRLPHLQVDRLQSNHVPFLQPAHPHAQAHTHANHFPLPEPATYQLDASLLEGMGIGPLKSTDESMRVRYEDDEGMEERRRLLRLIGGEEGEGAMGVGGARGVMRGKRAKV